MKLTQEQIDSILSAALPNIVEGFKKQITDHASWDVLSEAKAEIVKAITAWVKENVIPEIIKQLVESKDGLIALGPQIAENLCDAILVSCTEHLKKKLERDYDRREIFKALFQ
jgi:hypothetical protein